MAGFTMAMTDPPRQLVICRLTLDERKLMTEKSYNCFKDMHEHAFPESEGVRNDAPATRLCCGRHKRMARWSVIHRTKARKAETNIKKRTERIVIVTRKTTPCKAACWSATCL